MDDHPTCIMSIIDQTPPEKHTPCTGIHPHGGGVRIPGINGIILSVVNPFLLRSFNLYQQTVNSLFQTVQK